MSAPHAYIGVREFSDFYGRSERMVACTQVEGRFNLDDESKNGAEFSIAFIRNFYS